MGTRILKVDEVKEASEENWRVKASELLLYSVALKGTCGRRAHFGWSFPVSAFFVNYIYSEGLAFRNLRNFRSFER